MRAYAREIESYNQGASPTPSNPHKVSPSRKEDTREDSS